MADLTTLKQLRDYVASVTRETQVSDLIDDFLNMTGIEIHNYSDWTWLRRKQTFATVASQESYNLDSEVDRIALLREIDTPIKLTYLPDHLFYRFVPDPENQSATTPRWYRLWEETGFATNLSSADTVYIKSSSSLDSSSFTVRVVGRNSSGEVIAETLTLNGTTAVTSSTTFAANGLMAISKSGPTTGTITCYDTTSDGVLSELEPDNLAPRFKRISLYPIPSSAVTMYLEYLERYRYLVHNTDTPQMDSKWNWVLVQGALAKMWMYKQNEVMQQLAQRQFESGLKRMRSEDTTNLDYVPVLQRRVYSTSTVRRDADSVSDNFPSYSLVV